MMLTKMAGPRRQQVEDLKSFERSTSIVDVESRNVVLLAIKKAQQ